MQAFAHSLPGTPLDQWELLPEHLGAVATLAGVHAQPFGCAAMARTAGLVHDVGKLSEAFQAYIRNPDARRGSGGDHSTAGALIARNAYGAQAGAIIAAIVAAHHAGLADGVDLDSRLRAPLGLPSDLVEAATGPLPGLADLRPTRKLDLKSGAKGFSDSFLVRMLFSCLVDADFIATERFYAEATGASAERGGHAELAELNERLRRHMSAKRLGAVASELNTLRADILDHATSKAALAPGLFTLTVPTGGGKTLASLSFALEHAVRHGLKRVIFVAPYTSIIEQTAQVFRDALGAEDDILEHHSNFDWERARGQRLADDEAPDALSKLQRAAENWDAPIVVTTAVQFFESLFANKTSRCRKLHNIAESVVVLDEAQTMPLAFLRPCLAALEELSRNYRATAVICTATQPALRRLDGALVERIRTPAGDRDSPYGLDIDDDHELAPNPPTLYEKLRRTTVEVIPEPVPDAAIVERFAERGQMLAIVNTRAHAQTLHALIRNLPGAAHLSTLMCPRHRRLRLVELRARLKAGEPVRLVSTSLIEAGVDISFEEVWRAAAGLENVAQTAGRCNREGELKGPDGAPRLGRVVVFEPDAVRPQHDVKQRWEAAQVALRRHADPLGLDAVRDYFSELYFRKGAAATDAAEIDGRPGVLPAIAESSGYGFPFRSIAEAFRFIDEDAMEPVVVPWRAHEGDREADTLLKRIAGMPKPLGRDMRALQQYVVPIPKRARDAWLAAGVLRPVHRGLGDAVLRFVDTEHYGADTGVTLAEQTLRSPASNVIGP